MKIVIACLMVLSGGTMVAMAEKAELRPVVHGREEAALSVFTPAGRSILPVLDISLEGSYPDGRPTKSGLLILFDPGTHRFFWEHSLGIEHAAGFRGDILAGYADGERLIVFRVLPGPVVVYVWEAGEKADSLYDAETMALEDARKQLEKPQSSQWSGWREVPLSRELGRNFTVEKYHAEPFGKGPKFIDISHHDGKWEVTLEALWKEKITLNDKYEVTKMERVQ